MSRARQDLCPRCGGDNRCEVVCAGRRDVRCWCMEATLPARPMPAAGTACFCADCAAGNEKAPASAGASPAIAR